LRVLIVEDDVRVARGLKERLGRDGYAVDLATDGVDGEHLGREEPYDAIILDLGLPQRGGLEVLRNWRRSHVVTPVLILTAREAWHEKVAGLKAGADDYLVKPFHIEELAARIQALVRRDAGLRAAKTLDALGMQLDEERQCVRTDSGVDIELTGTEFRLLRYFMFHPGAIVSKSRLLEHIYAGDEDPDSNVIEVYVTRLRHKLGKGVIQTRRGQGYVFAPDEKI